MRNEGTQVFAALTSESYLPASFLAALLSFLLTIVVDNMTFYCSALVQISKMNIHRQPYWDTIIVIEPVDSIYFIAVSVLLENLSDRWTRR